jgi:hypothetical protein
MKCTCCLSYNTRVLGSRTFLKKYNSNIYICNNCNLVFVDNPFWLDEAYSIKYETDVDPGRYWRNDIVCKYINDNFTGSDLLTLLDFGSGEEKILEKNLQNTTLNIKSSSYDKYFDNEPNKLNTKYNIFTAIEVAEHIPPKEFWDTYIDKAEQFIITTGLHDNTNILDWGYFARDFGQHINLYSLETLKYICETYNLECTVLRCECDLNIIHFKKV